MARVARLPKQEKHSYMVFAGRKYKTVLGESGINWNHDQAIIGVFFATDETAACQAAAIKAGFAGTFFAVEGFAWGIDQYDADVNEYGAPRSASDSRLDRIEQMLEKSAGQLAQLPANASEDRLDQIEHEIDEIERLAEDDPDHK